MKKQNLQAKSPSISRDVKIQIAAPNDFHREFSDDVSNSD
jgi:hypothetical protein